MLVPRRILGGILAATLGLTWGLTARSEPQPPPGAILPDTAPDIGTDAAWRVVSPVIAPEILRPRARPALTQPAFAQSGLSQRPLARPLNWLILNGPILNGPILNGPTMVRSGISLRPQAREDIVPDTRWDGRSDGDDWTRAALSAINAQRHDLSDVIPRDIAQWCPAYADNPERLRDAFWVGMMSALARYESRLDPSAVGGGGLYHGLLQIYPATARTYGCAATTGQGLQDPEENLACAVRIMAATVSRDDAVAVYDGRWRGVAADWGPMTNSDKRAEMSAWTREQDYCTLSTAVFNAPLPPARPWTLTEAHLEMPVAEAVQVAMLSSDPGYPHGVQ